MKPSRRDVVLLVGAFSLLALSLFPAVQTGTWIKDWWDSDDLKQASHSQTIHFTDWDYSEKRATSLFQVTQAFAAMHVNVGIGEGQTSLGQDEIIQATVTGPTGQTYGPWYVSYDEECHVAGGCPDSPGGHEWIIIVSPPLGQYEIALEPGPQRESLPSQYNLGIGSVTGYFSFHNDPWLKGNNIWWYYPDGSKEFVEDGGYVTWGERAMWAAFYGGLTSVLWTGAVILIWRFRTDHRADRIDSDAS